MKCIKHYKTGEIRRVSNEVADRLVLSTFYNYATKSEWKESKVKRESS